MNELEYQKRHLQTKIEAQRTILGLELRAARASFDPLGTVLRLFGVDRSAVELAAPVLRAALHFAHQHKDPEGESHRANRESTPTAES